jgi:hypothetical protein
MYDTNLIIGVIALYEEEKGKHELHLIGKKTYPCSSISEHNI